MLWFGGTRWSCCPILRMPGGFFVDTAVFAAIRVDNSGIVHTSRRVGGPAVSRSGALLFLKAAAAAASAAATRIGTYI